MRERDINRKLFHKGHYEIIAARFREFLKDNEWTPESAFDKNYLKGRRNGAIDLAISLAKRLQLDNEEFEPVIFLDRCSPDPELYPLSELWPGVDQTVEVDG